MTKKFRLYAIVHPHDDKLKAVKMEFPADVPIKVAAAILIKAGLSTVHEARRELHLSFRPLSDDPRLRFSIGSQYFNTRRCRANSRRLLAGGFFSGRGFYSQNILSLQTRCSF